MEEFKEMIVKNDPMKEFEEKTRKINWELKERECRECGNPFQTKYPAKIFCDNCSKKEDKKNKNESVIRRIQKKRVTKDCVTCGNEFILSAPAMRKCENCSISGGKIVEK